MQTIRLRIEESTTALRGAFANPALRRVQLAFAGSAIGLYANSIAVAGYAFHHRGAHAPGIFMFSRFTVAAGTAPFAASLGDRLPQERVMLASDLLRVATVAGCGVVAVSH